MCRAESLLLCWETNCPHGSLERTERSTEGKIPAILRLVEQVAAPLVESIVATDAISALMQSPARKLQAEEVEDEEHTINSTDADCANHIGRDDGPNVGDMNDDKLKQLQDEVSAALRARGSPGAENLNTDELEGTIIGKDPIDVLISDQTSRGFVVPDDAHDKSATDQC